MGYFMSLFKYFGEQSKSHNGTLFWSTALNGFPYRGPRPPLLRQDELDQFIDVHWDFHCKEFDLEKEEDRNLYQNVMDRIINGWYYLHHREHVKDITTGRVRYIYVEWSQRYGHLSPELHQRGKFDDDSFVQFIKVAGENNDTVPPLAGLQAPDF